MEGSFDPQQLLRETVFAVFDVETTGLSPAYGHRVCEVACLRVCDGAEVDAFEALINPGRQISPGAFRVNRITPSMLEGAPAFDAVADRLLEVMEGAVLVAHNAPFDLGFLAAELEIARRPSLPSGYPVVDTLSLSRRAYSFFSHSLPAIADALDLGSWPTHRAMADVWTTSSLLERLLDDVERRWAIVKLGDLIEFQGGPIAVPRPRALPLPLEIAEALASGGTLWMRYVDARGRETERVVQPLRVDAREDNLYLIAHCYRRDELRTFRLDRVLELAIEG
jgi:DNA polymerase III epsilon subunit family exonuclease